MSLRSERVSGNLRNPEPSAHTAGITLQRRTLLKALAEEKYEIPTPIQAKGIPPVLAGHDLLGATQNGLLRWYAASIALGALVVLAILAL